jgi:branched-subunit amino acid transport protein AzlD
MMNASYTRTHKMGELYEEYFYHTALLYDPLNKTNNIQANGGNKSAITMNALIIDPCNEPGFDIHYDNWKRKNKVPQLVLNATCLNTGHNFQFTAKWMGVPPGNMQPDIDVKPRLRRMYYTEAPREYENFRLGYAVAASSCVPLIFRALPMKNLYKDMNVQLIDGGYHENQGVAALLEQECKNLIVSDGSGQLATMDVETPSDLGVFYRSDVVVQERVRELEFMDIKNRQFSSQVESISIVHLRKGLTAFPRNWVNCQDPHRKILYDKLMTNDEYTNYGVDKVMQQKISEVRTDLDSFNDTECYMLMYDGYMQMNKEITAMYNVSKSDTSAGPNWHFMAMTKKDNMDKAKKLMPYSKENAFKIFRYKWQPNKKRNSAIVLSIVLLILAILFVLNKAALQPYYERIGIPHVLIAALIIAGLFFWKKILHIVLSVVKAIIFYVHLHITDKWFISAGKIDVSEKKAE